MEKKVRSKQRFDVSNKIVPRLPDYLETQRFIVSGLLVKGEFGT